MQLTGMHTRTQSLIQASPIVHRHIIYSLVERADFRVPTDVKDVAAAAGARQRSLRNVT